MTIQHPSIPDPPLAIHDEHGTTERVWYLYKEDTKIFIRFLEISVGGDQSIGQGGCLRIQWHDPNWQGPHAFDWKDENTPYANAYCPTWYARKEWHEFIKNNYYPFTPMSNAFQPKSLNEFEYHKNKKLKTVFDKKPVTNTCYLGDLENMYHKDYGYEAHVSEGEFKETSAVGCWKQYEKKLIKNYMTTMENKIGEYMVDMEA